MGIFVTAARTLKLLVFGKDKPALQDFSMLSIGLVNPITGDIVAYVKADGSLFFPDGVTFSGAVTFGGSLTTLGTVSMFNLSSSNPGSDGVLWNDGGVLSVGSV